MAKKKRINIKGFTLIELLAVIVILAVIALIAVPQVLKILNKTRKSAAEDSTYGIVKAAESYVGDFMLKNNGTLPSEKLVFNCSSDGCSLDNSISLTGYNLEGLEKLDYKGTKAKSGIVTIGSNGNNITVTNLNINGFNCNYTGDIASCEKGESGTNPTPSVTGPTSETPSGDGYTGVKAIVYLDPTDLTANCTASNVDSTTGTTTGCMKWYAYADDGTNYTMILNHNTTATIDNWNNRTSQLTSDIIGWNSSLNPRLITANDINIITEKTDFDSTNRSSWYYFDTKTQTASSARPNNYGWLSDRTKGDCINNGCLNNATGNNITQMYGYWIDTILESSNEWNVRHDGLFNYSNVDSTGYGIRPVITVPKNIIS